MILRKGKLRRYRREKKDLKNARVCLGILENMCVLWKEGCMRCLNLGMKKLFFRVKDLVLMRRNLERRVRRLMKRGMLRGFDCLGIWLWNWWTMRNIKLEFICLRFKKRRKKYKKYRKNDDNYMNFWCNGNYSLIKNILLYNEFI